MPKVSLMNVCVQHVSDDETTREENRTPNIDNSNRNRCKFMQENAEPLFM